MKDLCNDKAYEKSCPVVYTYHNKKKNLVLMHSLKIPRVSQSIGSYLTAIIQNNNNNNITFYLWDITQAYIEIALDLNPNFYIQLLSKLILQLNISFGSIIKVIRPLYGEPEADNHWLNIYYPYYKEKLGITKFGMGGHNLNK